VVVERGDALVAHALHHGAPAPLPRLEEERRQHRFERLTLQVIEGDLGHRPEAEIRSRRAGACGFDGELGSSGADAGSAG
jgi:hypothetical protein